MKTREKRDRLLVALHRAARSEGMDRYVSVLPIAESMTIERVPGELRTWVRELESQGALTASMSIGSGPDGGMSVLLTSRGHEAAEDLLDEHPDYGDGTSVESIAYAASVDVAAALDESLSDLRQIAVGSNSIGDEDRQIALAEIAIFEAALLQPVIATDLVSRFVNIVLKWIGMKFADGATSAVIATIILNLAPFLKT